MSKKRGNKKKDLDDDFDETASKVSSVADSDIISQTSSKAAKKKGAKGKGKKGKNEDWSDDEAPVTFDIDDSSSKKKKGKGKKVVGSDDDEPVGMTKKNVSSTDLESNAKIYAKHLIHLHFYVTCRRKTKAKIKIRITKMMM